MTSPKEDQQPMTTREELVGLRDWLRRPDYADEFSLADVVEWMNQRPVAAVERLASRQEASVEAIAREFRRAMLDNPTDGGFNARATARERIADEYARALLAEYSITKRTTEG